MLVPVTTTQFKRDKKIARKQGKDFELLEDISVNLMSEKPLDPKHQDHPLSGNWKGHRECHIQNDWLLIYRVDKRNNTILFARLGSHSELFG